MPPSASLPPPSPCCPRSCAVYTSEADRTGGGAQAPGWGCSALAPPPANPHTSHRLLPGVQACPGLGRPEPPPDSPVGTSKVGPWARVSASEAG